MKTVKRNRTKVLVAMSGGVDSSVAAAFLKRRNFQVAGAFIKCWDEKDASGECLSALDEKIARQAARRLNIPFYTFDFTKEYRKKVFDYFIAEYKAGRTPNPDVICNKYIKFGIFLKKALALGFDKIATGHYARLRWEVPNPQSQIPNKSQIPNSRFETVKLLRGVDKNKDQSYFLWQLTQEQLRHCLFPIGDYTKPEVRDMARKFGLPNAERKDSQGLCFVGKVKLVDFLAPYIQPKKGKIIDTRGNFLGWHRGVAAFTIGQRHGIGLAGGPYFVVDKDVRKNILVVSRNEKDLYKKEVVVRDTNWIAGKEPQFPIKILAAIRYRQGPEGVVLAKIPNSKFYILKFDRPQRAVASGQSAVLYKGRELLGGGVIAS